MSAFPPEAGDAAETTLSLLDGLRDGPTRPSTLVLMRHAARHYGLSENDLENPLSDEGRAQSRAFGAALPRWSGFATHSSSAERCIETAELIAHAHRHPRAPANRPCEELSVFYVRNLRKVGGMMKHLGSEETLRRWFAGEVPPEVMMPPDEACERLLGRVGALLETAAADQLTLCVSHDWTLYLLRHMAFDMRYGEHPPVAYLEGFAFWVEEGELRAAAQPGHVQRLGEPCARQR